MSRDTNSLSEIRPASTFANYRPTTPENIRAKADMERLAAAIIGQASRIYNDPNPFKAARLIALTGSPGLGKTHLIEALIHAVLEAEPALADRLWLSRENFTLQNIGSPFHYGHRPIVILDDLFMEHHHIGQLHPRTDLATFATFIKMVYEERRLVIVSCNFAFKDGILDRVRECDPTGRIVSRLAEILRGSAELTLTGDDHRLKLEAGDPFSL